jgi:hypothetical protein
MNIVRTARGAANGLGKLSEAKQIGLNRNKSSTGIHGYESPWTH